VTRLLYEARSALRTLDLAATRIEAFHLRSAPVIKPQAGRRVDLANRLSEFAAERISTSSGSVFFRCFIEAQGSHLGNDPNSSKERYELHKNR
jgi:hypothetical protein